MTPDEVVWFINHKYGEQAYLVENDQQIIILSRVSKWVIFKKDFSKFHIYTLFHFNDTEREHYHVQSRSTNIDYLVFIAVMHDYVGNFIDWKYFNYLWEMYNLGREIEECTTKWEWLAGNNLT